MIRRRTKTRTPMEDPIETYIQSLLFFEDSDFSHLDDLGLQKLPYLQSVDGVYGELIQ